ncbi:H/ACA ribonucleo protein complex subunit 2 [Anaeromyces robustus]|uniref:H/ACA ribonucleoprotein complex subunit 2 n=1 Tax=Anaeromyces robustus TaxID=1754192 RepID=A0A1Y1XFL0_9FUNG|nr:H/ACA ribonucleo protein complex subunit 2 [Anaeromyces robustus]|eukprot:ORX84164.1 H/ACA ribonucleo protein complex subunit 2 [Anaeromyces robustus]
MAKDGKVKKEKKSESSEDNYESRLSALNEISKPLASKKLNKKLLKTVRKASKAKDIKRGVKEVVKGLRKGNKGLVIIAGDISPIDVITHVPILCEESDVPYCYVPSKEDLGTAGSTKRPTSCVMIVKNKDAEYKDLYEECVSEVKEMEVEA